MARASETTDGTDPSDETVELDGADDPEFADGFEVFDPDEEQPELSEGDDDVVVALIDEADDDLVVEVVPNLDDSQFDSDDIPETAIDQDDPLEDEVEGVRGTEFVCLGCYLAKRRTQLADKKRSLCIDCV